MTLNDLQDGQTVRARWGRAGAEDVNWGPWQSVQLYVQRHKGRVTCVALKGVNWAEYGPRDFDRGLFFCEDYYLEIEGLT